MDKLEQQHLIVQWVNALLDPVLGPILARFGVHAAPGHELIPDYIVISTLIVIAVAVFGLIVRSRLSVENPGKGQILLEDVILAVIGMMDEWLGPEGRRFLPLVGALGVFVLFNSYIGLVPGFMAPTSNINVTVGCAITTWVYYHYQGIRKQGPFHYILHFAGGSEIPMFMKPLFFLIEIVSHASRVLSLSLRLFGNIFGEELVILILAMLVPYMVPLPIMALGLITGLLQAYVFVLLTIIYLQGAVVVESHDEPHGEAHGEHHAAVMAA
jgi:F-type H+-transporting ATPase subunit a